MTLKRILPIALLALIAAGAYYYWQHQQEAEDEGYLTASVDRGPIAEVVTATGIVNALATVQVGTYVSGPIIAIDVDFNSPVRKGQRVAKIDPAAFLVKVMRAEANLANARAGVDKARADLELKRLTLDRFIGLRGRDFVSQNDLDIARSNQQQAQAQVALSEASVRQADADLRDAQINLAYTDITAPVDGVVVSRSVDVGQTVAASFQTPTLFQIAQDLSRMQVITSVSESDIATVHEQQAATFTVDAFPSLPFDAKVVQVRNAPVTVQNVVTYDVVLQVDNRELKLKPGMTANVTIITATNPSALRVPLRAIGFDPERARARAQQTPLAQPPAARGEAVWRMAADGTLERVPVQTGLRDEAYVEIMSGDLNDGEQLAVGPKQVRERTPVAPPLGAPRMR